MTDELKIELLANGYTCIKEADNIILGICRMAFTTGLFYGLDQTGYRGRFCFHTYAEAKQALDQWTDFTDFPPGNWIKHKGIFEYSNPKYND